MNVPDVQQFVPVLESIPSVTGKPGRSRLIPKTLFPCRAYNSEPVRCMLWCLGIELFLAKRGTAHGRPRKLFGKDSVGSSPGCTSNVAYEYVTGDQPISTLDSCRSQRVLYISMFAWVQLGALRTHWRWICTKSAANIWRANVIPPNVDIATNIKVNDVPRIGVT